MGGFMERENFQGMDVNRVHEPRNAEFIPPQRRHVQEHWNNSNAFANTTLNRHECRAPFARFMESAFLLIAFLIAVLGSQTLLAATANPPDRISYQGFLTDNNGAALAPTSPQNFVIVFRIYDASQGGTLLWSEQQTVTVDKGVFSVLLGEGSQFQSESRPVPLSSVFQGSTASDRYLGMTVTSLGNELQPRMQLLASPYAFLADQARTADTADKLSSGSSTFLSVDSNDSVINTLNGPASSFFILPGQTDLSQLRVTPHAGFLEYNTTLLGGGASYNFSPSISGPVARF